MRRLELLDAARFLAAVSVMLFHYTFNGVRNGKISSISAFDQLADVTKYGYLGVEFFFIVSGFVIAFSYKGRTAGQFLTSRVVRIFPIFWAGVLFTTLVSLRFGVNGMAVTLPQVLANFTLVPQVFGYGFVDGVYWTLVYECFFYAIIFGLMFVCGTQAVDRFF